jgi:hypothetical protein
MADFTYTTVPGKIKPFLEKIRQVGVPPKASAQWLKSIGYLSSNDSSLVAVLKFIGLIDATGIPTGIWSNYRGAHHKKVLGEAIRNGYAELFAVYPNAWEVETKDIEHVFSTSSSAGKQVISKTIATFNALCELAEFGTAENQPAPVIQTEPMHTSIAKPNSTHPHSVTTNGVNPSVHIDIQIHISPEASIDQIDQIFKSMAKHLYGAKEN